LNLSKNESMLSQIQSNFNLVLQGNFNVFCLTTLFSAGM